MRVFSLFVWKFHRFHSIRDFIFRCGHSDVKTKRTSGQLVIEGRFSKCLLEDKINLVSGSIRGDFFQNVWTEFDELQVQIASAR